RGQLRLGLRAGAVGAAAEGRRGGPEGLPGPYRRRPLRRRAGGQRPGPAGGAGGGGPDRPGSLDDPDKFRLTSELLRIVFPYLALVSMTALAGAVLNSFERFALPALTPVLHNLAVIAAMLALSPLLQVPIKALAWGVLAAGALQLLLLWPAMGRLGL